MNDKDKFEAAVVVAFTFFVAMALLFAARVVGPTATDVESRWQDWVTCRTMLSNPAPCDEVFSPPNADGAFHTVDEDIVNLIQHLADQ